MSEVIEKERKWLVVLIDDVTADNQDFIIRQSYLKRDDGIAERVRETRPCYTTKVERIHMTKEWVGGGVSMESMPRTIDDAEYKRLVAKRVGKEIVKTRIVFDYEGNEFELDLFQKPIDVFAILELETENMMGDVKIPPFLKVIAEVTGDIRFSNSYIAQFSEKVKVLAESMKK